MKEGAQRVFRRHSACPDAGRERSKEFHPVMRSQPEESERVSFVRRFAALTLLWVFAKFYLDYDYGEKFFNSFGGQPGYSSVGADHCADSDAAGCAGCAVWRAQRVSLVSRGRSRWAGARRAGEDGRFARAGGGGLPHPRHAGQDRGGWRNFIVGGESGAVRCAAGWVLVFGDGFFPARQIADQRLRRAKPVCRSGG